MTAGMVNGMKIRIAMTLVLIFLIIEVISARNVVLGDYKVDFQMDFFDTEELSVDLVQHQGITMPDSSGNKVPWNSHSALIQNIDGKANITVIKFDNPGQASKEDLVYEVIEKLSNLGYYEASLYGLNDDWEIDGHPGIVGVPKDNKDNLYVAAYWINANTNVLIISEYPFNEGTSTTSALFAWIHVGE